MEKIPVKCSPPIKADSSWPYYEYYLGDKDTEQRRDGSGVNHWSGAESLEWYTGNFIRDTMHGEGEYRWRFEGPKGTFLTHEGWFFGNRMHGYGSMSYPDGSVFNGIFYNDMRWGPGIESSTKLRQNVGLWRGNQLVRLTWRPKTPSVSLDFNFGPEPTRSIPEAYRTQLATNTRMIGEVNSAIELLKQKGAAPIFASENWNKLYPKSCNDLASRVCHVELFNQKYYKNKIVELNEVETTVQTNHDQVHSNTDDNLNCMTYYAWNNSEMMVSMMKHCFKHEMQRKRSNIDLKSILSGTRVTFHPAAKHEYDSRLLILSSYLGDINKVAQLINEENVHPDVADILGNTALMYAVCGNQTDVIHFLVEAGANVDNYNDSCCTPLGVALVKFACLNRDIPAYEMVQALSPPPQIFSLPLREKPSEWHMTREMNVALDTSPPPSKGGSKTTIDLKKSGTSLSSAERRKTNANDAKKRKPVVEGRKTNPDSVKKNVPSPTPGASLRSETAEIKSPEGKVFHKLHEEFSQKVTDLFTKPEKPSTPIYLYEVIDMIKEIDMGIANLGNKEERNKATSTHSKHTGGPKEVGKTSRTTRPVSEYELSVYSQEQMKSDLLDKTQSTITQLLKDGADPKLVRCPQPALFSAMVSGRSDLVRQLVQYGANINETFPPSNYTMLDLGVSRPLSYESLALVQAILETGGLANYRLRCNGSQEDTPGPTLLHAVVAKRLEDNVEEEICFQLLELLLNYGCDANAQYCGISAMDMAMTRSFKLFEIFVQNTKSDLNAVINDDNQTILVKLFSMSFFRNNPISERLQILTSLLLHGADPLLVCSNNDTTYKNIFEFAKKNLSDMEPKTGEKLDAKIIKKPAPIEKPKKEDPKSTKLTTKPPNAEDVADYRQALYLVRDCARILHVRWIQAKLMRDLLNVVEKFEHRHWNMILPEHKNKKGYGQWLTMPRCLEIYDIFKAKKKKKPNDRRILKHMLCIVHYYGNRLKTSLRLPLIAEEKDSIDNDVMLLLREHNMATSMSTNSRLTKLYVMPELIVDGTKFQVCFECALLSTDDNIFCKFCNQVSFCSLDCLKMNAMGQNANVHPCSQNLINRYFSTPMESSTHM